MTVPPAGKLWPVTPAFALDPPTRHLSYRVREFMTSSRAGFQERLTGIPNAVGVIDPSIVFPALRGETPILTMRPTMRLNGVKPMISAKTLLSWLCSGALAVLLTGCGSQTQDEQSEIPAERRLSLQSIVVDDTYKVKSPKSIRWLEGGSGYTVLEDVDAEESAADNPDDVAAVAADSDQEEEDDAKVRHIVLHTPQTREERILVSVEQLTPRGATDPLQVHDYAWSQDRSKLLIFANAEKVWRHKDRGDYWLLDLESDELWQLGGEGQDPSSMYFAKLSPNGTKVAYVREDDLFVQDLADRSIVRLSSRASPSIINGRFSWAYEEEFQIRDGFRWSPDSRHLAYWQFDTSGVKDFLIINNTDDLYPTITRIPYPKVGETVSAARVGVVSVLGGETVWADLPGDPRNNYIPRMDWANNDAELLVQYVNRKQDRNDFYFVDIRTGAATVRFTDEDLHFLDDFLDVEWVADGDAFTLLSERSGWRHVHRVSRDGAQVIDLTPGDFDVTEVAAIDDANGWLYFMASPEDPTQRYLYRTRLDGSGDMERITPEEFSGTNAYNIAPGMRWAIHTHSSFMQPPQYRLIELPAHSTQEMLESNQAVIDRLAELALGEFEFFRVATQDGLELDGYLVKPTALDPARKYPLINYVYGEVAGQTVRDAWGGKRHLWHLMLAQRGFAIASIDNRGTRTPRGREWRKSVYGAIGVLASRDQSDALQAMQERWPWLDADRVGIYGHSGGGSMTLNMLFRYPEQYHVGISGAPVTDQRLYDAIYQERYSGLLEEYADAYVEASPITHAEGLQGKLLLIHGTADDNVHYQGSERLINELVRLNKAFDLLSYPNRSHSLREGDGTELHRYSTMTDYFTEHLHP
jgi:dipeptidyl-peptidase-4